VDEDTTSEQPDLEEQDLAETDELTEDPDAEQVEAETDEAADQAVTEEAEPEPAPVAAKPYVPLRNPKDELQAAEAALKDIVDPEFFSAIARYQKASQQVIVQGISAGTSNIARITAQHPALMKVHGEKIMGLLSECEPELQANPFAMNMAISRIMAEEATETGDIAGAAKRMAELLGNKSTPSPRTAPRVTQRVPTGGNASAAPAPRASRDSEIAAFAKRNNLSMEDARTVWADERVGR